MQLFSPLSWETIPNTLTDLEDWEHVTCVKNVNLMSEGTRSGLKGYLAVGTSYNYGEDVTIRGRVGNFFAPFYCFISLLSLILFYNSHFFCNRWRQMDVYCCSGGRVEIWTITLSSMLLECTIRCGLTLCLIERKVCLSEKLLGVEYSICVSWLS